MSDTATIQRQLKIKTGVAQRLTKENQSYWKEAEDQKRKLDKLVADKAEDWYIKNAGKMMEESNKMIKDSADRLAKAVEDLRYIIISAEKDPALADAEEFVKAKEALEIANA